jgi:hypothetical protein
MIWKFKNNEKHADISLNLFLLKCSINQRNNQTFSLFESSMEISNIFNSSFKKILGGSTYNGNVLKVNAVRKEDRGVRR